MSYATNEKVYLKLIRRFLSCKVNGEAFCREFMHQWRSDRDEEYAKTRSWSERYDLQLIEAYNRYEPLVDMLNRIFTACDAFDPAPEGPVEIDEEQLRKEVTENLESYEEKEVKQSP